MASYVVWVGGMEITDYQVTMLEAQEIANLYREDGYNDVKIETITNDFTIKEEN